MLGSSAYGITDRYVVRTSSSSEGVYVLESTGELVAGDFQVRGEVVAEHRIQVTARIGPNSIDVLEIDPQEK